MNCHTIYKATHRTFQERFLVGLSWYHTKAIGRREEFPSWSWAGWRGDLHMNLMIIAESSSRFNNVRVWIEDDQGTLSDFPTSTPSQPFSSHAYSHIRFIHMEAFTIPLSAVYLRKKPIIDSAIKNSRGWLNNFMKNDGHYIKFEVDENICIYARLHLDQREQDIFAGSSKQNRNDLIGILVGEQDIRSGGFVLVIREMEGYAERVGLFNFHDHFHVDTQQGCLRSMEYLCGLEFSDLSKWFKDLPRIKRTIRLGYRRTVILSPSLTGIYGENVESRLDVLLQWTQRS